MDDSRGASKVHTCICLINDTTVLPGHLCLPRRSKFRANHRQTFLVVVFAARWLDVRLPHNYPAYLFPRRNIPYPDVKWPTQVPRARALLCTPTIVTQRQFPGCDIIIRLWNGYTPFQKEIGDRTCISDTTGNILIGDNSNWTGHFWFQNVIALGAHTNAVIQIVRRYIDLIKFFTRASYYSFRFKRKSQPRMERWLLLDNSTKNIWVAAPPISTLDVHRPNKCIVSSFPRRKTRLKDRVTMFLSLCLMSSCIADTEAPALTNAVYSRLSTDSTGASGGVGPNNVVSPRLWHCSFAYGNCDSRPSCKSKSASGARSPLRGSSVAGV